MAASLTPPPPARSAPAGDLDRPILTPRGRELVLWAFVAVAVSIAFAAAAAGVQPAFVLAPFVIPLGIVAGRRVVLAWPNMLAAILACILFIPMRRYTIGGGGPVAIEPYRVLIAIVLGCWFLAIAVDPKVTWRPTGWGAPVKTLWLGIIGSLALNLGRVNGVQSLVLKQLTFFLSYFLVMCFVASILKRGPTLERAVRLLVGGGTIVACFALYEWRSGHNYFNDLHHYFPFLHYSDQGRAMVRGHGVRAVGSAQHPIALGAALVMLLPLTVYLHKQSQKSWWLVCAGILTLGALATGSRTAAVMLVVILACFFVMRWSETVKLLPALLVLMICIQGVMPGTLTTFKTILNPQYIVKEQSTNMGGGSGRIADIGPSLKIWSRSPFVGQGYGTRITSDVAAEGSDAQILDDQWLGSLLEIGAVGALSLAWLFSRAIRRLARKARSDPGPEGWLAMTLATSLTAFAIGMFTFDAFAFIQVTFFAFILLGFAAVLVRDDSAQPTTA